VWRRWLKVNHARASEVWPVFWKKHTGQPGPSYNEAVEEALCYGWIASPKRDETRQRRFQKAMELLDDGKRLGMV
jgi:uncharacterized protein YdeI (YjbR/CyaY-like superfamily)